MTFAAIAPIASSWTINANRKLLRGRKPASGKLQRANSWSPYRTDTRLVFRSPVGQP